MLYKISKRVTDKERDISVYIYIYISLLLKTSEPYSSYFRILTISIMVI